MTQTRQRRPAMYLVIIECTWDDAPLRLFTTRKEAEEYAAKLNVAQACESMRLLLDRELTDPLYVSIVRFNASGHPKRHTIVRDLEEEDTDE